MTLAGGSITNDRQQPWAVDGRQVASCVPIETASAGTCWAAPACRRSGRRRRRRTGSATPGTYVAPGNWSAGRSLGRGHGESLRPARRVYQRQRALAATAVSEVRDMAVPGRGTGLHVHRKLDRSPSRVGGIVNNSAERTDDRPRLACGFSLAILRIRQRHDRQCQRSPATAGHRVRRHIEHGRHGHHHQQRRRDLPACQPRHTARQRRPEFVSRRRRDSTGGGTLISFTDIGDAPAAPRSPPPAFAQTQFSSNSTAGNARLIATGGGLLAFRSLATAGSATITATDSFITFEDNSTGGNAAITANGAGSVDFSGTTGPNGDNKVSAGSIAGSSTFFLGSNQLTVGNNNLSTNVSGTIEDGGSLRRQPAPRWSRPAPARSTLTGVNTYSGGTTVTGGLINFAAGNNLGTGAITLNGGGLQWAAGNTARHLGAPRPAGRGGRHDRHQRQQRQLRHRPQRQRRPGQGGRRHADAARRQQLHRRHHGAGRHARRHDGDACRATS